MDGTTPRRPAGRYALDRVVGRGAMGTVWAARDELLGREVAVKEVRTGDGFPDGAREARFAARVAVAGRRRRTPPSRLRRPPRRPLPRPPSGRPASDVHHAL
jgi:hypothetical protein